MANFSVNQVRQLYVGNAYNATVNDASAVGTIGAVKCIADGQNKELYLKYKGADGILKSDSIQLKNLDYIKAIAAEDMIIPMKKVKVSLDANVNGGAPVNGQDYVLGINFKNFFAAGDAVTYYKDAAVHATAGMTAAQFYTAMVDALNKAFSRENGATATSNPYLAFSADATGITVMEKPQEWALGIKKQRRVMFDLFPSTIYTGGDDVIWGTVADITPDKATAAAGTKDVDYVGDGKNIADLEWFCMGERGDQYRMIGWPNYIPTQYLVDPSKEYNTLEIHYAFTDSGVNSYRTEKEMTIVSDSKTVINDLIGAINTATGLNIATR